MIGQFTIFKYKDSCDEEQRVYLQLSFEHEHKLIYFSSEIDDDSFKFTDNVCEIKTRNLYGSAIIPWFTDYCRLTSKDGFYYADTEEC